MREGDCREGGAREKRPQKGHHIAQHRTHKVATVRTILYYTNTKFLRIVNNARTLFILFLFFYHKYKHRLQGGGLAGEREGLGEGLQGEGLAGKREGLGEGL